MLKLVKWWQNDLLLLPAHKSTQKHERQIAFNREQHNFYVCC
jgi:hypothetical protein